MKKILITGAGSYIGTRVEKWILEKKDDMQISTVDTMRPEFLQQSFVGYDTVFHVAGIAHVSADPSMEELYYKINRDLAVETARKARKDGVSQFIFMSSIIVYGQAGEDGVIDKTTKEEPENFYGKSKLEAEKGLLQLETEKFKVVIIRPPMIYGPGSKGNYPRLANLAAKIPFFPLVKNQRSMLFIDNLCELIYLIIKENRRGTFYPQNKKYVNTSQLVREIAACHDKKLHLLKGFNGIICLLRKKNRTLQKMFGNLIYDMELSQHFEQAYCVADFKESISLTEKAGRGA